MELLRLWPALATLLLALALAGAVLPDLPAVLERLAFPFQRDDSEGVILAETRLLLDGVDIYRPVRPDLFTAAPYPPLFYWLLAPLLAAGLPPFETARAVTAVATLLLGVAAGGLVTARSGQPVAGLLTAGLWLAPNLVAVWSVRVRPDLLALLVNLLGLAVVWWLGERAAVRPVMRDRGLLLGLACAAALFAAGFYFKHTALAAPAAAGLYLLLRRPVIAVWLGGLYATAVLLPFGLLSLSSDGGFAQHLIAFHRSWLWSNYAELAAPYLARYWPLLALAGAAAVAEGVRARRPTLAGLYLATAALISLGGGTHGGNNNHLLELLLASALAIGLAVGHALPTRLAAPAVLLSALVVATLLLEPGGGRAWLAGDLRPPGERDRLGWEQVLTVVAADPGPIYSDNVGLLLLADQPVRYTDPFTLAGSVEAGLWSDADLVGQVRARRFSLIALRYDVNRLRGVPTDITPALLAAVRDHYDVADRNVMILYRPRP